jgi:hypothetical protein
LGIHLILTPPIISPQPRKNPRCSSRPHYTPRLKAYVVSVIRNTATKPAGIRAPNGSDIRPNSDAPSS